MSCHMAKGSIANQMVRKRAVCLRVHQHMVRIAQQQIGHFKH
jgi:hypothetical protein